MEDSNAIDGFATIRACSANVFLSPGKDEMVIDVYRMQSGQVGGVRRKNKESSDIDEEANSQYTDPMARFSGDWEKSFLSPSSAAAQWTQENTVEDYKLSLTEKIHYRKMKSQRKQIYPPQVETSSATPEAQTYDGTATTIHTPKASSPESTTAVPKEVMRVLKAKSISKQSGMGIRSNNNSPASSEGSDGFKFDFNDGFNTPITAKMRGMWGEEEYLALQTKANINDEHVGGPKRVPCPKCKGTGRRVCYNCGGRGVALQGGTNNPTLQQCLLCVGTCTVGCSTCQGEGYTKRKRKLSR